jgi:hypothetical protein
VSCYLSVALSFHREIIFNLGPHPRTPQADAPPPPPPAPPPPPTRKAPPFKSANTCSSHPLIPNSYCCKLHHGQIAPTSLTFFSDTTGATLQEEGSPVLRGSLEVQ